MDRFLPQETYKYIFTVHEIGFFTEDTNHEGINEQGLRYPCALRGLSASTLTKTHLRHPIPPINQAIHYPYPFYARPVMNPMRYNISENPLSQGPTKTLNRFLLYLPSSSDILPISRISQLVHEIVITHVKRLKAVFIQEGVEGRRGDGGGGEEGR